MTGQELYETWSDAMNEQGVSVDEWDDLDDSYRSAWISVAGIVSGDNP